MKKTLFIMTAVAALAAVLGLMLPALLPSPDIIGGAGMPSMRFFLRTLAGQACFLCLLLGIAGLISWGASLLLHRAFAPSTALLALGASMSLALGLDCMLMFAGCFIMTHPSRHPIALPVSVVGGILALIGLWLAVHLLIKRLKREKIKTAVLLCTVLFTCHLLPFMYLFSFGYDLAKAILK